MIILKHVCDWCGTTDERREALSMDLPRGWSVIRRDGTIQNDLVCVGCNQAIATKTTEAVNAARAERSKR